MNLLILSIGGNPLPNYIVAKYLLKSEQGEDGRKDTDYLPVPDKIMMVFSQGTKKFRNSIVKILGIENDKVIDVDIEDKQRSFGFIYEEVKTRLASLGEISSLQYNYTGGTKPMVVAITQAVEELFPDYESDKLILSDFSPETFKIMLRNGREYPTISSIRQEVEISIEELYNLHDIASPTSNRELSEFYNLERIKSLFEKRVSFNSKKRGEAHDFFTYWNNIDADFKKDKESCKSRLIKSIERTPFAQFIPDIEKLTSKNSLRNIKSLKEFIRGDFLEEYVFHILQEMQNELKLTDIAWNVEAYVKQRPFEIDVIAVRGCQVFVISCTTDNRLSLCKGKAFEVLYRANMIGGGQAQSVLVCLGDNQSGDSNAHIDNIIKDMHQFDATRNFHLISKDELLNKDDLKNRLREIIGG